VYCVTPAVGGKSTTWLFSITVGVPRGWKPSMSAAGPPRPALPPSTAPWFALRALPAVLTLLTLPRTYHQRASVVRERMMRAVRMAAHWGIPGR